MELSSWSPFPGITVPTVVITHKRLDEARGSFEALSYVWGDSSSGRRRLLCGDSSFLWAGRNLLSAIQTLLLRQRRDPSLPRRVWIDAICINQADDAEKSQQVYMMRDIYQSAECTVAHLGEAADDSGLAMRFINRFGRRPSAGSRTSGGART